jgi:hypothetical protein
MAELLREPHDTNRRKGVFAADQTIKFSGACKKRVKKAPAGAGA